MGTAASRLQAFTGRPEGRRPQLLDLGFLEFDMLAHDRVVLVEAQLLGLGARVLLGDVKEAGISRADELDLDGGRLGHDLVPVCVKKRKRQPEPPLYKGRAWPNG